MAPKVANPKKRQRRSSESSSSTTSTVAAAIAGGGGAGTGRSSTHSKTNPRSSRLRAKLDNNEITTTPTTPTTGLATLHNAPSMAKFPVKVAKGDTSPVKKVAPMLPTTPMSTKIAATGSAKPPIAVPALTSTTPLLSTGPIASATALAPTIPVVSSTPLLSTKRRAPTSTKARGPYKPRGSKTPSTLMTPLASTSTSSPISLVPATPSTSSISSSSRTRAVSAKPLLPTTPVASTSASASTSSTKQTLPKPKPVGRPKKSSSLSNSSSIAPMNIDSDDEEDLPLTLPRSPLKSAPSHTPNIPSSSDAAVPMIAVESIPPLPSTGLPDQLSNSKSQIENAEPQEKMGETLSSEEPVRSKEIDPKGKLPVNHDSIASGSTSVVLDSQSMQPSKTVSPIVDSTIIRKPGHNNPSQPLQQSQQSPQQQQPPRQPQPPQQLQLPSQQPPAEPVRVRHIVTISDDETDAFFARKPIVPGIRKRNAKIALKPNQTVLSLVTSSSSSSSEGSSSELSENEVNTRHLQKKLKLPLWTKSLTGAEANVLARGVAKDRKKKNPSNNIDEIAQSTLGKAAIEAAVTKTAQETNSKRDAHNGYRSDSEDSIGSLEPSKTTAFGATISATARDGKDSMGDDQFRLTAKSDRPGGERDKDSSNKRRERSKSVTPPIAVSNMQMKLIEEMVRRKVEMRHPPALQQGTVAQLPFLPGTMAQIPVLPNRHLNPAGPSNTGRIQAASSALNGNSNDARILKCEIRMVFDPDKTVSPVVHQTFGGPYPFKMKYTEPFSSLYQFVADKIYLTSGIDIVLTYRSKRIYPFGNPKSMNVPAGRVAEFKCHTKEIYSKIEELRRAKIPTENHSSEESVFGVEDDEDPHRMSYSPASSTPNHLNNVIRTMENPPKVAANSSSSSSTSSAQLAAGLLALATSAGQRDPGQRSTSAGTPVPQADLFKITLKGSVTQSLPLAVKRTNTFAQLVKQYCKKFEIPEARQKKMLVDFDGEEINLSRTVGSVVEDEGLGDDETVEIRERR